MNDVAVFAFNSAAVRALLIDGEPWFVAGDLASILGYREAEKMTRMLDDDEKGAHIVGTLGGNQQVSVVTESGLYACVLKSRRPEAKTFRKWVTSEVLPAIRKTGSYQAPGAEPAITRDPSHVADLTVAASRNFNALLRSARAAGISLPKALRQANAVTLRKTGLDILAEIDAEAHVEALEADPTQGARGRARHAAPGIADDPLEIALSEWAETAELGRPYLMQEILAAAIGMGPEHRKYAGTMGRAGPTLHRLGFTNRAGRLDGKVRKLWTRD